MTFDTTINEFSELHDPKSIVKLIELGGIALIQQDLDTDLHLGLPQLVPDKLARQLAYGENRIPAKLLKSFLQLCWELLQDKVLIMLSVAAVVSLALGLYETFGQPTEYDDEGKPLPKVEWVEGVAIIVAILIVVLVGAANDYQKERQFAKLNSKKEDRTVIVYREGIKEVISVYDLVVGDVLALETGDIVPADLILTEGRCECDESALTGETNTIKKTPAADLIELFEQLSKEQADLDIGVKGVQDPMMISGSKVLSGVGRAVVTAVGPHSMNGRTLMSLKGETEETPLQMRLNALADGIAKFGFLLALLLFVVLFIRFLCLLPKGHSYHHLLPSEKGTKFLDIIITAITIIVVAVPEGLPLAVTLALAFATTRMSKDGNLVRHLRACETMGGATAVCSDKTGTLTENRMRVVKGVFGDEEFDNTVASAVSSDEVIAQGKLSAQLQSLILDNIAINSSAFENKQTEDDQVQELPKKAHWWSKSTQTLATPLPLLEPYVGSKTETALLLLLESSFRAFDTQSLDEVRSSHSESIVQVIPFESSRKWGGVVLKHGSGFRLYVKGASELVFSRCNSKASSQNEVVAIDALLRSRIDDQIEGYAKQLLRTLSILHRDYPNLASWPPKELASTENGAELHLDPAKVFGEEVLSQLDALAPSSGAPRIVVESDQDVGGSKGLVLDAIVGIQDPLRQGVPELVLQCKSAGVTVRMVTGDNLTTAKAISLGCNILLQEEVADPRLCMEGPKFRKLSDAERFDVVPHLRVLARSSPDDKRILVKTLRDMGEVVAVTGDGTNDAPALKLADVGFSMGIAGTEVARELSDIILMTDDFTAIVNAIKWGRTIAISIRKFIQFQLTVNVTAVVLTFVSAVASSDGKSVLTAVQLLWVNLIMDTLAALALATDKPDDSFLKMKPAGRHRPLITVSMWKMIMGQALVQLVITFVLHFAGAQIFYGRKDVTDHESTKLALMTFNTFVWLQFFCLFVARKLDEGDGLETVKLRISWNNLNFFLHIFRNMYFVVIALIIGGFQILIMYVGGSAFSISRNTGAMWGTLIICGLLSIPAGWLIRIVPDHYVVKYFPTRAYRFLLDVLTLQFLRKGRSKNANPEGDLEMSPLYEFSPFLRAKNEIVHMKSDTQVAYNPVKRYRDWRSRSSSSLNSSNVSTLVDPSRANNNANGNPFEDENGRLAPMGISALAMVPTVVGGAVGGWHQGSIKKSSSSSGSGSGSENLSLL